MARIDEYVFAFQNQCLCEKSNREMVHIKALQIFRSRPRPENHMRKVIFIETIALLRTRFAGAKKDYQHDQRERGRCSAAIHGDYHNEDAFHGEPRTVVSGIKTTRSLALAVLYRRYSACSRA